ncbi:hypothetical protein ACS125_18620 [Acinetobacter sp. PFS20]|uniref:hypothetical protein n=1 Tax=Acinetobacter sp. PFS20 TaxID=3458434 RepID=UPI003FD530A9
MIKSLKVRVGFVMQAIKLAFQNPNMGIKNTLMTMQWNDSKNTTLVKAESKGSYLGLILGLVVNVKRQTDSFKKYDNQKYVDFCSNALQEILVNRAKPTLKRKRKMRADYKKVR